MIRMHATFDDIDLILDLCVEGHDIMPNYQGLAYDLRLARESLGKMVLNNYALVAHHKDGVLIGVASPSWWHKGLTINDVFFYARRNGLTLLREYLAWAKAWPGDNEIYVGTTSGIERAEKLYDRLGVTRVGATYRVNA